MKVIVSVTNDIVTDRRVAKSCMTLYKLGYDIVLIGRRLKHSLPMDERPYRTVRMRLLFTSGAAFYAEYNVRLFLYLLFHKFDLLLSNDLDTLLANHLASLIKSKELVYDSHEYFTEVPELKANKFAKKTWEMIEGWIFPKLKHTITVNDSIAELYNAKYGKHPLVVRNIPPRTTIQDIELPKIDLKGKSMLLMQGAGINIDRGGEELVQAMQYVDNAVLYIIGKGDVIPRLKEMIIELNLIEKVIILPAMTYERLIGYTSLATIGLTLDKNTNINYLYSLPNKLFDYIQNWVPIIASNMVEVEMIIKHYNVGETISTHEPQQIAMKINSMLSNPEQLEVYRRNCKIASQELCWENEEHVLIELYDQIKQKVEDRKQ